MLSLPRWVWSLRMSASSVSGAVRLRSLEPEDEHQGFVEVAQLIRRLPARGPPLRTRRSLDVLLARSPEARPQRTCDLTDAWPAENRAGRGADDLPVCLSHDWPMTSVRPPGWSG